MNSKMRRAIGSLAALLSASALLLYQNCSRVSFSGKVDANPPAQDNGDPATPPNTSAPLLDPKLNLVASATTVSEGQSSTLTFTFQDLKDVSYTCIDSLDQSVLARGTVSQSGTIANISVDRNLHCEASGTPLDGSTSLHASVDLTVNCGNRVKNAATNRCEDFNCKVVKEISLSDLVNIPERTSEGICFAAKIMNAIPLSDSGSTSAIDQEVLSRDHDHSGSLVPHNAYQLGLAQADVRINGPRAVKLTGGLSATEKILVDNFILMGLYPASVDVNPSLSSYYRVMGTSDSSIFDANGNDTHSISFRNNLIPVIDFGVGGTSSVSAVDVTSFIEPKVTHKLDVRALDCGGVRELSNIYLLFQ